MVDIVTSGSLGPTFLPGLPFSGEFGIPQAARTEATSFSYTAGGQGGFTTLSGTGFGFVYEGLRVTDGTVTSLTSQTSITGVRGNPNTGSTTTYSGLSASVAQLATTSYRDTFLNGDDRITVDFGSVLRIQSGSGDDRVIERTREVIDPRINPFNAPSRVDLGAGDDTLELEASNRTFQITLGEGADTIVQTAVAPGETGTRTVTDFDPKVDRIVLSDASDAVLNLVFVQQGADGAEILFGNPARTTPQLLFVLDGVNAAELTRAGNTIVGASPAAGTGLTFTGSDISEPIFGTDFADILDGLGGDDNILGFGGADRLFGGAGNDTIDGGAGDDRVEGGAGNDTIFGAEGNDVVLGLGGNDDIYGGDGLDVLVGNEGRDVIFGGLGDDQIQGGADDDVLLGESGDDILQGGDGADSLDGGVGADRLSGDAGNDILFAAAGDDRAEGGTGNDTIFGGAGDDLVEGNEGADAIDGEAGADVLGGGDGDDLIFGGMGNDAVYGGDGADVLRGGAGDDLIDGQGGGDFIFTGTGNDVVIAGTGNDVVQLGAGNDRYVLEYGFGIDTVYGFRSGEDVLDLSALGLTREQFDALSFDAFDGFKFDIGLGNVVTLVGSGFDADTDLIL